MLKLAVVGFASALVLRGPSLNTERDLAKCKLKAIELYRPPAHEGEWRASRSCTCGPA
jgi:hypothetical protein